MPYLSDFLHLKPIRFRKKGTLTIIDENKLYLRCRNGIELTAAGEMPKNKKNYLQRGSKKGYSAHGFTGQVQINPTSYNC